MKNNMLAFVSVSLISLLFAFDGYEELKWLFGIVLLIFILSCLFEKETE